MTQGDANMVSNLCGLVVVVVVLGQEVCALEAVWKVLLKVLSIHTGPHTAQIPIPYVTPSKSDIRNTLSILAEVCGLLASMPKERCLRWVQSMHLMQACLLYVARHNSNHSSAMQLDWDVISAVKLLLNVVLFQDTRKDPLLLLA